MVKIFGRVIEFTHITFLIKFVNFFVFDAIQDCLCIQILIVIKSKTKGEFYAKTRN